MRRQEQISKLKRTRDEYNRLNAQIMCMTHVEGGKESSAQQKQRFFKTLHQQNPASPEEQMKLHETLQEECEYNSVLN